MRRESVRLLEGTFPPAPMTGEVDDDGADELDDVGVGSSSSMNWASTRAISEEMPPGPSDVVGLLPEKSVAGDESVGDEGREGRGEAVGEMKLNARRERAVEGEVFVCLWGGAASSVSACKHPHQLVFAAHEPWGVLTAVGVWNLARRAAKRATLELVLRMRRGGLTRGEGLALGEACRGDGVAGGRRVGRGGGESDTKTCPQDPDERWNGPRALPLPLADLMRPIGLVVCVYTSSSSPLLPPSATPTSLLSLPPHELASKAVERGAVSTVRAGLGPPCMG